MEKNINQKLDHLFRREYGSIVAGLSARFGINHLERVEDAVQEALLKAMRIWPHDSIPEKPGNWLYRVAYNQMIDGLRKEKRSVALENEEIIEEHQAVVRTGREIEDEQLKMIFACCNPILDERDSLLLALKLVGGFSIAEIARALRIGQEAAKKSVQRARKRFREKIKSLYFPEGEALENYQDRVQKVIYLIFNEGYKASVGDDLIREDLCGEAIRLALLLANHHFCANSNVFALISLMSFKASRFEARVDSTKELVLLEDQDRAKWNAELIRWGFYYFNRSSGDSDRLSRYKLEAAIEFYYHIAPSYSEINWQGILQVYNLLLRILPDAGTRLNYLVVLEKVEGTEKALLELEKLGSQLRDVHLYHAVHANFCLSKGDVSTAREDLKKAIFLSDNEVETAHLRKQLRNLA
ncbi:MAG: RNA polymerase sigma factor [Owenweeksia sp.]